MMVVYGIGLIPQPHHLHPFRDELEHVFGRHVVIHPGVEGDMDRWLFGTAVVLFTSHNGVPYVRKVGRFNVLNGANLSEPLMHLEFVIHERRPRRLRAIHHLDYHSYDSFSVR